jgi:hypothetical protein
MTRIPAYLLLAVLAVVVAVIVCATVLTANGNTVPSWFEWVVASGFGGVLGAYQPAATPPPAPAGTPVSSIKP